MPTAALLFFTEGKGGKRVCECFSRVELLLAFAAVVQEAMLRAWFVGRAAACWAVLFSI